MKNKIWLSMLIKISKHCGNLFTHKFSTSIQRINKTNLEATLNSQPQTMKKFIVGNKKRAAELINIPLRQIFHRKYLKNIIYIFKSYFFLPW